MAELRFCPRCNHSLGEIDRFCAQCGASLSAGAAPKREISWRTVLISSGAFLLGILVTNPLLVLLGPHLSPNALLVCRGCLVAVLLLAAAAFAASQSSLLEGALVVIGVVGAGLIFLLLIVLIVVGLLGRNGLQRLPTVPIAPARTAVASPRPDPAQQYKEEKEREAHALQNVRGYDKTDIPGLLSEPKRYDAKKVAFTGFYSGQGLDQFYVFGRWAKGGMLQVDGNGLTSAAKRQLLSSLDGFHRVLVTGVFRVMSYPAPRHEAGGAGAWRSPNKLYQVTADQVVDLGRADPNAN